MAVVMVCRIIGMEVMVAVHVEGEVGYSEGSVETAVYQVVTLAVGEMEEAGLLVVDLVMVVVALRAPEAQGVERVEALKGMAKVVRQAEA